MLSYLLLCLYSKFLEFSMSAKLRSMSMYFLGTGMSLPYWDFTGSTMVTTNHIRLTPDIQSRSGAIWNSVVSNKN